VKTPPVGAACWVRIALEESMSQSVRAAQACLLAVLLLAGCQPGSRSPEVAPPTARIEILHGPNPWTHLDFQNDPGHFTFAIVSDLTGGYREGVFEAAVDRLQLLRPEFIVSVGDFIEGYTEDREEITQQWDTFDAMLGPLSAPFFYVPGNHDYSNEVMAEIWHERRGRDYYHFVYGDVLFLAINTERTPIPSSPETRARLSELFALGRSDPEAAEEMIGDSLSTTTLPARLGEDQVAYFERVIADNPDVRHTFLLMHKPIWQGEGSRELDRIESALGERPFTAFAGHIHNYERYEMGSNFHIRLGTTGGSWIVPGMPGSFDHVTLITMTNDGPSIANLVLEGILDSEGRMDSDDRLWRAGEK
jgi:hypothetical protein